MDHRKRTGQRGEDIAAAYFAGQGYTILRRNWRCPAGELDIIMEQGHTLIFVEVRTRTGPRYGTAEESITPAKQARLIELAQTYLQQEQPPHTAWRIDVAAINMAGGQPQLNHLKNAVGW